MKMDKCAYEKEINQMALLVSRMDKDINGNGKKGLRDSVTELNIILNEQTDVIKDLKTVISGLSKFANETKAIERWNDKKAVKMISIIALVFTGITILINVLL